ncbi:MAG TPA: serine/threonine-protein kinase [Kofleriaceae bacterium]|nr:serine/threonine-protein kinase [Kofleriaceae bacterium]
MEGDDEATAAVGSPTVLDRPTARPPRLPEVQPAAIVQGSAATSSAASKSSLGGGTTTTISSAVDALARDEVLRTRNFCFMGIAIAAGGLAAIPFLPGGYYETRIFIGFILVALVGIAYLLHRTRNPATFHDGPGVAISWYIAALAVNTAVPYFGPFSPAAILLLIGIYFVGLGASRALAIAVYLTAAVTQAVSAGLAIARIADPGIIRGDYLTIEVQIICQGLIQMVYAATFFIARSSRRASLVTLGELQAAIRGVAQREALLQEAREELRRALGSGRGRFSDQTIGHYRLGDVIGRGAMGEVYDGIDTLTNQPVAVKMLSQTSLGNTHHVQRFLRELKTAASVDSPNVVRVLDIGEEPLPHLVMERLRGRDLSSILREKRVLPPKTVIEILQQVGAGITTAGAAGVIHRDLKPQNVFLADTTWKILDFGVSRLADTGDTLTAGHLIGTPAYMAPEQARGAQVDHRADLYALAAIAYRCLVGHAPLSGGELADLLYRVVHDAPRRPSFLAQLPADVDLALAIGLAKRPDDRFHTAGELAASVAAALEGRLPEPIRARGRALELAGAWAR